AGKAVEKRRHRHGAYFGRANVRHRVWHGRAAYCTRGRGGRASGAGKKRRPDRAGRGEAQARAPRFRAGTCTAARTVEAGHAALGSRLGETLLRYRITGRRRRRSRLPRRQIRREGRQGKSLKKRYQSPFALSPSTSLRLVEGRHAAASFRGV